MVQLRGLSALTLNDLSAVSDIDVTRILEEFRTKNDLIVALKRRGSL